MRVIARKMLERFWQKHSDARDPLLRWYSAAIQAQWTDFAQTRDAFARADRGRVASGRPVTVFNIGGNKFGLIAAIHYKRQIIFVLRIFTHAEYDRVEWKSQS